MEIVIEVWGDFAAFTQPQEKTERRTYPFPTPSSARGILSAIYSKPAEFYWNIQRIEVLNQIRYISFKRNEVKAKTAYTPIYTEDERTQRQTVALQDVRYRIAATICPRPGLEGMQTRLNEQALRRIRGGKTYYQPSLGLKEFVAYFEESDGSRSPIPVDMDVGLMVYDVFDLHDFSVRKKTVPRLSLFHAVMKQGVVLVPPYDSDAVIKGGAPC